jgi:hypothetical protein
VKLTPEQTTEITTGVKPPTRNNFRMPSAESERYNDWKGQFQKDNGRPPNAAELAAFGHVQKGNLSASLSDKIEAQKNKAFSDAQQQFAADKNAENYQQSLQDAQDFFEQRIENATGEAAPHVAVKVDKNGNVNWGGAQASPAAPAQAAAPAQQPAPQQKPAQAQPAAQSYQSKAGNKITIGTPVVVNGRKGKVSGFDAKGKPTVDWEAGQ